MVNTFCVCAKTKDEAFYYWVEIALHKYEFSRLRREAQVLSSVTLEQVKQLYEIVVMNRNLKEKDKSFLGVQQAQLSSLIISSAHKEVSNLNKHTYKQQQIYIVSLFNEIICDYFVQ